MGSRFAFLVPGIAGALIVACSGATRGDANGGTSSDAGLDGSESTPSVSAGPGVIGSGGDCMNGYAGTEIDQPWMPPVPAQDSCDAKDIDTFAAAATVSTETFDQLRASLSSACAACVFSSKTDAHWALFVADPPGSGEYLTNQGACYADATGGNVACGEAMFRATLCLDDVCPRYQSCANCPARAFGADGACAKYSDAAKSACGANAAALDAQCLGTMPLDFSRLLSQLKVLCAASGSSDAGADAAEGGT